MPLSSISAEFSLNAWLQYLSFFSNDGYPFKILQTNYFGFPPLSHQRDLNHCTIERERPRWSASIFLKGGSRMLGFSLCFVCQFLCVRSFTFKILRFNWKMVVCWLIYYFLPFEVFYQTLAEINVIWYQFFWVLLSFMCWIFFSFHVFAFHFACAKLLHFHWLTRDYFSHSCNILK